MLFPSLVIFSSAAESDAMFSPFFLLPPPPSCPELLSHTEEPDDPRADVILTGVFSILLLYLEVYATKSKTTLSFSSAQTLTFLWRPPDPDN